MSTLRRVQGAARAQRGARTLDAALCLALALGAGTALADGGADAAPGGGGQGGTASAGSGGVFLPGTQPGELTQPFRPPTVCADCHGYYSERDAWSSWQGSMMANAGRDPLFHAALTVANQDIPGAGDLCLRCHAPRGWLFGRSEPPRLESLLPDDFEGVDCDFCHRLVPGPNGPLIGTGQYHVADDFTRRGPIADAVAPHEWEHSPYFEDSRLCGLCHDVSNPLQGGFAIERTYTEWAASAYPAEGASCMTCHLPAWSGAACGAPGMPERTVHAHVLAGGNSWMPLVLAGEHPELGREQAYQRTAEAARGMLESSARLELSAPSTTSAGGALAFSVRVTNLTGHKLPTGYPEGRRSWLEVVVRDARGAELLHSGAYDTAEAARVPDPQLRTYEVRLAAGGVEGFHFVLQDSVLEDSRIPPRGFIPADDTRPVGRAYAEVGRTPGGQPMLAHWDDAPYRAAIPDGAEGPLAIEVTLHYQTTSREYVEALRDANVTDDTGQRMHALWEKYGRAPPVAMARASVGVSLTPGGADAGLDADAADAEGPLHGAMPKLAGGCACDLDGPRGDADTAWCLAALFPWWRRLRRRTSCPTARSGPPPSPS